MSGLTPRTLAAMLATAVTLAWIAAPRQADGATATLDDLQPNYFGKSYSDDDESRQAISTELTAVSKDAAGFSATQYLVTLPSAKGVGTKGGFIFPVEGSVKSKGKISYSGNGTGQGEGLKFSFKGTLTAEGHAILGKYTVKRGKQVVDKGTYYVKVPVMW
jgi:hypothetical protein